MADRTVAICAHCGEARPRASRGLCRRCYSALRREGRLGEYLRQNVPPREWLAAVDKTDQSVCWHWTGAIGDDGYGRAGSGIRAHRWHWIQVNGTPPKGLVLDHNCHNLDRTCAGGPTCLHRRCINLAHLVLRTLGENTLASHVTIPAKNAAKTHCPRGHEYDEVNTYWNSTGRNCRACQPIVRVERRARLGIANKPVPRGSAAKQSISIETARAIKSRLDDGGSTQSTANQFGVCRRTVQVIKRGLHWSCREGSA